MEIIWSPRARTRLKDIGDYIAKDASDRAASFEDRLESVERLREFPDSGAAVPENKVLRQVLLQGYRLIYRIRVETVEVVTIISPGQSFDLEWQRTVETTVKEWSSQIMMTTLLNRFLGKME